MLKKVRVYVAILLITILLTTPLIFSEAFSAKACPPPPPETLLSLYLRSDLVFVGDFISEKDGETTVDEETYRYVDVTNNIIVSKVLKGKIGRDFSYVSSEYRDKSAPEETATDEYESESYSYSPYGYTHYSKMTTGNRYLFFFTKNGDDGNYELTDYISGFKNLNDHDLEVHEGRLEELQAMIDNKENQLAPMTDWLIKCIEEPATRWDGVMSLQNSFNALEYEDEEEKANRKPFVIDEDFSSYAPEIADNLTVSQKNVLSGIVFSSLQQTMFEGDGYNYNNNLDDIVKKWDKPRLAMFAFSLFQSADKSDVQKTTTAMRYIISITEDNNSWEIIEKYEQAGNTEENADEEITSNENQTADKADKPTAEEIRANALQEFSNRYYQLLARNFVEETEEVIAQQ